MHLVIDGHGCDYQRLADPEHVRRFLDYYPDAIDMTKITVPTVYTYKGPKPEDWGVSGFVIIAESHISVHTFPDRGYVNIDVFSCKAFDVDKALAEVRSLFPMQEVRHWVLDRGLEHLDPVAGPRVITEEREAVRNRS
ncbi:MAG: adenosylmethionine decarboxylase [SAR202 cluster bacterium]|nr:adenosylmethionine decarboxylase [SAR202 cluster bacterium]